MKPVSWTFCRCLAVAWLWCGVLQTQAAFPGAGREPVVSVSNYWSHTAIAPAGQITLALVLDIRAPYHINSNQAKDPFIPTTVELVDAPPELRSSTPIFPPAQEIEFGSGTAKERISVFSGRAIIYVPMAVTAEAKPGDMDLQVRVSYQACDDQKCLFPTEIVEKVQLRVSGPISGQARINNGSAGTQPAAAMPRGKTGESSTIFDLNNAGQDAEAGAIRPINQELFAGLRDARERLSLAFFGWDFEIDPRNLWLLLLMAALGGFLLNFTPCVLPLIPLKIMGLSRSAGNRRRCFILGLILSLGVVAFWLGLALAISGISGFNATNKLFQYPAFTIGVGVVIWIMAVGMCGLFAIRLPQSVYRINPSQESIGGSFLFGIMTAVLSTPCTAPFMGAAAAWSATQPPVITLSTFAAIGLGMAIPYLVLSAFPVLVHRMPRTGPASELIKQVMGLLMLAAGAYFLGTGVAGLIARPPDPPTEAYWWIVALFVAAAGAWLVWRTIQITPRAGRRLFFGGVGALLVLAAIVLGTRFTKSSPIHWVYYTPQRLADAQSKNDVVVLEFTAAWCLNCHALEQAVLHDPKVVDLLNAKGVTPIKVDITGNNPAGNQKLVDVGRRTIPYLIVYSPRGEQVFASDAYTVDQLTAAIRKAHEQARAGL